MAITVRLLRVPRDRKPMSQLNTELILVVTTSDDLEELNAIAAAAIEQKLAACAQVLGPITSHYVWDGKTVKSTEYRCEFKTTIEQYEKLEQLLKRLLHYDEPEIVFFQIDGGSKSYLKWVSDQSRP